jgi:hypothetical protein
MPLSGLMGGEGQRMASQLILVEPAGSRDDERLKRLVAKIKRAQVMA